MSPRVGLSADGVVDAALALVDERGTEALTLANVAARTGVATPSLYKHVGGLAELRALVGVRILDEMTTRFSAVAVGRGGDAAVAALMREYRAYVLGPSEALPVDADGSAARPRPAGGWHAAAPGHARRVA